MNGRRLGALGGLVAAIVLMASCLSVLVARSVNGPVGPRAQIGLPAPRFSLTDLDGKPVTLDAFRGKVTVLAFVDSRCPIANEYQGRIQALAGKYGKDDRVAVVNVLSNVATDTDLQLRELRVQRKVLGQPVPMLIDRGAVVARAYGVAVTPTVCVIDPYGTLRYVGSFDDQRDPAKVRRTYCANAVTALLDRRPLDVRETDAFGCPLLQE